MNTDYIKEDTIGLDTTVWSPCGAEGMLNIKSSIGIIPVGTAKPALLTVSIPPVVGVVPGNFSEVCSNNSFPQVDSADLKYKQYYHLQWRRCTK